jgi:hypothetical protein
MPDSWLTVDYAAEDQREQMAQLFQIKSIPTLITAHPNGQIYTMDGVDHLREDGECGAFPWSPAAVAAAQAARGPAPLQMHDAKVLRWACENTAYKAMKEQTTGRLSVVGMRELQTHLDRMEDIIMALPGGKRFDPLSSVDMEVQPQLLAKAQTQGQGLSRLDLLALGDRVANYAGKMAQPTPPQPIDILQIPKSVATITDVLTALETTQQVCFLLLDRAQDSSTSSRLVLQYEVVAIIGEVFTNVLPIPDLSSVDVPMGDEDDVPLWQQPLSQEMQLKMMSIINRLALAYGQMWQAIENPARFSACECTLVASCMLAIFDTIVRRVAVDAPLLISLMLQEHGGYRLSSTVCQDNRSFIDVAARLELIDPKMLTARSQVLAYLKHREEHTKHSVFTFREPDKIEVKKYGSTILFLRGMLERLGFELVPRDQQNAPPEMEALVEWMIGENTQLARLHPEWQLTRDMVALFKVCVVGVVGRGDACPLTNLVSCSSWLRWKLEKPN